MAHHHLQSAYTRLSDRLERFPLGAPPGELLFKILNILFDEEEAGLVAQLPIKPFTANKAAKIWKKSLLEARNILDELASRALLIDIEQNGELEYCLPPPMAGFFEFSMMRTRDDIDQKLLAELFYQYLNVEEDFIRDLFTRGETRLGRTFIYEPAIDQGNALHVLDYERASEVIKSAKHIGISDCYCRHKMAHMDLACDAPRDICMTFSTAAASLIKHGYARGVDAAEGMDLLQEAYDNDLVQFGENVRQSVSFICNCCGCCCEALIAQRRFSVLNPIHTTNFLPVIENQDCTGCGKCVNICPVEAMVMVSANDPHKLKKKIAKLDEEICLGCGLCAKACSEDVINMVFREKRVITPLNGTHKTVMMAIERGNFQDLIFDNRVMWSHRAMAAVLGVILRLPPIKQVMASDQVKSRFMETLIQKVDA